MRKPLTLLLASLGLLVLASPARSGLFLSELCDPQSNFVTDRFIEIYNSGPGPVDLAGWAVVAIANNVDVTTWPLSGTLPAGQARVCGNNTTVTGFIVHFQNPQWGASGYFNWNGRVGDGAKLVSPGASIVDIVVATGTLFENADLVRIPTVTGPSSVYVPSEWTSTPVALATDATPGSHNGSPVSGAGPRVSDIVTDPLAPVAGSGVHVQASVVDTSGAIASVTLQWGSVSGSYPNAIPMALESDSTYRTTAQIPGQSAGATIYHRIVAVGASATTTTSGLSYTIPGGAGDAPTVLAVGETSDSTLLVTFSEPVEEVTAQTLSFYAVDALVPVAALRDPVRTAEVTLTVRGIPAGPRTLSVNGVQDLSGNSAFGVTKTFTYVDVGIPPGYYASTAGLRGSALRVALHLLMRNHTVRSYAYALTAFATTDVKPNGKIWDMYSDVPGGTPPYEYAVGQTGQGGGEGFGYNREHTWPQSWFNQNSPMVSDLHMLYPTDSYVNNARGNYPFGEVATPSNYLSQNGSQVGPSATAGYSGVVFEPIDAFKGDLARAHLYVTARYLGQDAGWTGSPSTVGSQFVPWAEAQYRAWHAADPVSWKERLRNGAVYVEQNNRNPFVDHPEFVEMIYDSNSVVSAEPARPVACAAFRSVHPNPTSGPAAIAFELPRDAVVTLRVYDVGGRLVRTLVDRRETAGSHRVEWDGRADGGATLGAGLYFCRLEAAGEQDMRRIARVR